MKLNAFQKVAIVVVSSVVFYAGLSATIDGAKPVTATRVVATAAAPAPAKAQPPARESIEVNGTGKRVADVTLPSGLVRFSMRHVGQRNFSIWLLDARTGERKDLLANQIGPWDGEKAVRVESAGRYVLDVTADGDWQVVIR